MKYETDIYIDKVYINLSSSSNDRDEISLMRWVLQITLSIKFNKIQQDQNPKSSQIRSDQNPKSSQIRSRI